LNSKISARQKPKRKSVGISIDYDFLDGRGRIKKKSKRVAKMKLCNATVERKKLKNDFK
jgi:hypothetical protein